MGIQRLECEYDQSYSDRFTTHGESYKSQYYVRSMSKLECMKRILMKTIKNKWKNLKIDDSDPGSYKLVKSINYVKGKCVIIGTVFKHMKYQPSPLEEYTQKFNLMVKKEKRNEYTDDEDFLFLEDHTQRLMLIGDCLNPHEFVSGLVIAVRGYMNEQMKFVTEDYTLPEVPDELSLQVNDEEKFIAFTSGLELSGSGINHNSLMLLQNFILGDSENEFNKKLVRLVVAGNGIGECNAESLKNSDIFYAQLASSINVDLMPGNSELDPTNGNLPQQVINPVLMEHSKRYGTFRSTTNPYFFSVDGVRFLGVSGQSVANICKFSRLSEIEALRLVARSRCIAPTGTDSLPCHSELDVFNLTEDSEYPHVFFSGNCKEFAAGEVENGNGTKLPRLVCVPSFKNDPTLVLVSLSTLNVITIKLS
ncbi:DNA polymerase delta small subunit [Theileria orientalis strain Shintoku]|uniref:DNA polymerase delta small subunit n=1 Tax=Theileria orientalis strain Shintoku TaxID=869250 RepID=J4C3C4_THEOR|nr:DNA polymerase delta small subunit [Theileria orientalis strain Shintoku]BAM40196.1 DNA polymerase delta small subunit [Theileria orientalis strain Shintoku]|eukprot:XP_009690497.1 DNA polymerase delta small subunit [Theileria orientalis strain Shintoku]